MVQTVLACCVAALTGVVSVSALTIWYYFSKHRNAFWIYAAGLIGAVVLAVGAYHFMQSLQPPRTIARLDYDVMHARSVADFDKVIAENVVHARNNNRPDILYRAANHVERGLPARQLHRQEPGRLNYNNNNNNNQGAPLNDATPMFPGVPSNPQAAIGMYREVSDMGVPQAMIRARELLREGVHNVMEPDRAQANQLADEAAEEYGEGVAMDNFYELTIPAVPNEEMGHLLTTLGVRNAMAEFERQFLNFHHARGRYPLMPERVHVVRRAWPFVAHMDDDDDDDAFDWNPVLPPAGGQNVHDHAVGVTSQAVVQHMENETARGLAIPQTERQVFDQMVNLVNTVADRYHGDSVVDHGITREERDHAIEALDTIFSENLLDIPTGKTEVELLLLAFAEYERILADRPTEEQQRIWQQTFVRQLAAAHEFGGVVCNKGRAEHIMSITQGIDESVPAILSDDMLQQLAQDRFVALRNEQYALLDEHEQQAYETGDEPLFSEVLDKIKNAMRPILYEEYVTTNLMTEGTFRAYWDLQVMGL